MTQRKDPVTDDVLIHLRRIARTIDLRSRELMSRVGLTVPQLMVLREIDKNGSHTGSALARAVSLSHATVTGILKRLEMRNLVARRRSDADRRQIVVQLTAAGKELIEVAPSPLQSRFRHRFEALESWEQSMILASLQRLVGLMEAEDLDAAPFLATGAANAPASSHGSVSEDPSILPGLNGSVEPVSIDSVGSMGSVALTDLEPTSDPSPPGSPDLEEPS